MLVRVLVTYDMSEADLEKIRSVSDSVEVEKAISMEEALAKVAEAEVVHAGRWSDELWRASPRLKWVQSTGAGVRRFLTSDFIAAAIVLTNARGVYAVPIADHVMAFVLHFSRLFNVLMRRQMKREWTEWGECDPDELSHKTLGIIGLGGIGSEVAKRAKGFGMKVIATRQRPELPSEHADEVRGVDQLPWLLEQSDYVALCAALTPKTRHLIGEEQLKLMKPTAYLMNIGRGGLIDEQALIAALREGEIAGAGLDVFEEEPLPAESPLWDMPNVLITPHNSGSSPRSHERLMELFRENLRRYVASEPLLNVVDKQEGY
ncbi:MAG: D-2-hydroxyacid dehydrogenase [Armatimonadota bacterium]|nr:MAG: D-2-hydroxyacid dehydrogenase [Armatimonadota bacterium]